VFPGYCYHFDYPFQQKFIYEGEVLPENFRNGFRTARWTWWAYMDISAPLLEAWDLVANSDEMQKLTEEKGGPVAADIESMFGLMAEQIIGNRDNLTNMAPGMWANLVRAGRVLGEPDYVHTAIARLRRMVTEQFFGDGTWQEGAPSYHSQVMGGLSAVISAAKGYSDPAGYTFAETGERFDDLDIERDLPEVTRARQALLDMRLPNGRLTPVHDTWWTNGTTAPEASSPRLLAGLGHGILGRGEGDNQTQLHLTWSPGYGHIHYDGLSMLLFDRGRELLSDIGYTHTRWREWTITTAAHNLVVVDTARQIANHETFGDLRYFDAGNELCQLVSVDNPQVYPEVTDTYRRTLALVDIGGAASYVVDIFAVEGGEQHDYFLHGSADEAQQLAAATGSNPLAMTPLVTTPLGTLVPDGVEFTYGQNEQTDNCKDPGFAYGYLGDLRTASVEEPAVLQLSYTFDEGEGGLQAWCAGQAGDQLVLGTNPSIRQARDDDSKLGDFKRAFAMLRRSGGTSLFASIIESHVGAPLIEAVKIVDIPGAALALEVGIGGRCDLVIINADAASGECGTENRSPRRANWRSCGPMARSRARSSAARCSGASSRWQPGRWRSTHCWRWSARRRVAACWWRASSCRQRGR